MTVLAVDHKLTDAVFQSGLSDPGEAARPIIATSGDQPNAVAVTLDANAIAIQLYFVKPFRAGGNLRSLSRNAELKRLKHELKIALPAILIRLFGTPD
jgi:hypothetical protein